MTSKEVQLSASEEQALIALGARTTLRGDKRTDAKAGTIHAPTAKRLCEKGLAGLRTAGYGLTDAGKARLPGSAALQPTEPRDCRKYLGRTLEGNLPVVCDKPEKHKGKCGNRDGNYKARKQDSIAVQPQADVEAEILNVKVTVESRASLPAEPVGSLPESTRIWAQECADKAIGRKPKVKPVDAAPTNVDAPAVVLEALASSKPSATPAVLLDALDPSAPAPVFVNVTPEINDLVNKLHNTGTLLLKSEKGAHYRVNAQNHGAKGFEYWKNDPETGFWKRIRLGELPALLSGVVFVSDQPDPGAQPFRAPTTRASVTA